MRIILSALAILSLAGPVLADHGAGNPPGQAAENGSDLNGDGRVNGQDYAPGQSAGATNAADLNQDEKRNGKDYAPGQIPRR